MSQMIHGKPPGELCIERFDRNSNGHHKTGKTPENTIVEFPTKEDRSSNDGVRSEPKVLSPPVLLLNVVPLGRLVSTARLQSFVEFVFVFSIVVVLEGVKDKIDPNCWMIRKA